MLEQLKKLVKDEEAPTAVEYAIMIAGIAVVVMVAVFAIGDNANKKFEAVRDKLK
jgi:pilus assembly protein Flp/PilA